MLGCPLRPPNNVIIREREFEVKMGVGKKNDPPDYSVTGEFSPGALVIGGEPFAVGLYESYPTAPPDQPGASPRDTVVRRGLKLMKNVLFEAGACQGLADARWKRLWDHRLAYSGLFVDTAHASGDL